MPGEFFSHITIANTAAAERMAIELVRNTIIAYPNANVGAGDIHRWPLLRAFLRHELARYGARTDPGATRWDVWVTGDGPVVDGVARLVVALPGAGNAPPASRRVELTVGRPSGEVVLVPGTARRVRGRHTLTPESFERLRRAEEIARRRPVRAVVLSGWNGRDDLAASEAAQLLDAWQGPPVPVILDEAARTTAENALWSASLTSALGDVRLVRVVTSWVGSVRLGLAAFAALRPTGARPKLAIVWSWTQAASWKPSIVGLVHLRRHLRVGRALIARGPSDPGARL
jgi:DUF218 domain